MDRNHDGKDQQRQRLFGAATKTADGRNAGDGYTAMRLEDTNHDGKLTTLDAHYSELKVWVDANGNSVTDGGELHSLASLGIIEIDLHSQTGTEMNNGNLLGLTSS